MITLNVKEIIYYFENFIILNGKCLNVDCQNLLLYTRFFSDELLLKSLKVVKNLKAVFGVL